MHSLCPEAKVMTVKCILFDDLDRQQTVSQTTKYDVKGVVCKLQREDCFEAHIKGRVQNTFCWSLVTCLNEMISVENLARRAEQEHNGHVVRDSAGINSIQLGAAREQRQRGIGKTPHMCQNLRHHIKPMKMYRHMYI